MFKKKEKEGAEEHLTTETPKDRGRRGAPESLGKVWPSSTTCPKPTAASCIELWSWRQETKNRYEGR